jgi:hypothetical protein
VCAEFIVRLAQYFNDANRVSRASLARCYDEAEALYNDRAKAFTGVSNAIIATARAEIDMVKAVSGTPETDFIPIAPESRDLPRRLFGGTTPPKRLNGITETKNVPH